MLRSEQQATKLSQAMIHRQASQSLTIHSLLSATLAIVQATSQTGSMIFRFARSCSSPLRHLPSLFTAKPEMPQSLKNSHPTTLQSPADPSTSSRVTDTSVSVSYGFRTMQFVHREKREKELTTPKAQSLFSAESSKKCVVAALQVTQEA